MYFINSVRFLFILISVVSGFILCSIYIPNPMFEDQIKWAFGGLLISGIIVLLESKVRSAHPKALIIGLIGLLCGLVTAWLISQAVPSQYDSSGIYIATRVILFVFLGYFGLVIALRYVDKINFASSTIILNDENRLDGCKILDTSVIIDGRIADIIETSFVDGILIIPTFVLKELQSIADSADSMKRKRGRRGLDIVKRIQNNSNISIEILDRNFPHLHDVDSKLVELAKQINGKILTNDFNLNKVAEIHDVIVLNINDLANALKPIILPGEEFNLHIIKQGKEDRQGVGYLDDGTMVVVEDGDKVVNRKTDVVVTSILQTAAGRMIFAKLKGI